MLASIYSLLPQLKHAEPYFLSPPFLQASGVSDLGLRVCLGCAGFRGVAFRGFKDLGLGYFQTVYRRHQHRHNSIEHSVVLLLCDGLSAGFSGRQTVRSYGGACIPYRRFRY